MPPSGKLDPKEKPAVGAARELQQIWQRTGIGPPADTDRLQARITELEQQSLDLRLRLEEKDEELSAARAANRELTKTINQGCS